MCTQRNVAESRRRRRAARADVPFTWKEINRHGGRERRVQQLTASGLITSCFRFRKSCSSRLSRIVMMATQIWLDSSGFARLLHLLFFICLCFASGVFSSGVVTLESIQIFTTHEWVMEPTVYFACRGENKTFLPDVKKAHSLYTFKGEESWQPLTELEDRKCKRCGLYEKDPFNPDDVFDEWEFCPSDFTSPNGTYVRFKHKELNATFSCPNCIAMSAGLDHPDSQNGVAKAKERRMVIVIVITALVSTICIIGGVAAYRYWQRKRKEHDRARFLKLFEDDDDIENQLGTGRVT